MKIHLDFETFSLVDLPSVGTYRYAEDASTEILILSVAFGAAEPRVWSQLRPDASLLAELFEAVRGGATLYAHNATFERLIWGRVGTRQLGFPPAPPLYRWKCTAAVAAACALPRSLDGVAEALGLPYQKDKRGTQLIRRFSILQRGTARRPAYRIRPEDSPEEFAEFEAYCAQDVRVEREVESRLPPLPPREQAAYVLDQRINDRGIQLDIPLARKTVDVVRVLESKNREAVETLTGGLRSTQRDKFLAFLRAEGLPDLDDLQAETLRKVLRDAERELPPTLRELLELRLEGARASTKKLGAMLAVASPADRRARGLLLFNGAHTGRWSGRLVQPHNFIRGKLSPAEAEAVFALLETGDAEAFPILYDKPLQTISEVMRGFIVARRGSRLVIVDYSAIEARILFWIAGETAALDRYRGGQDLYRWMASILFRVPLPEVSSEQRRIGKNLILGCGYGLGADKFVEYCDQAGIVIDAEFSRFAVGTYRENHPRVTQLWKDVERAALRAVLTGEEQAAGRCRFRVRGEFLTVELPSGRLLYYFRPEVRERETNWGVSSQLTFLEEFRGHLHRTSTYGGKLVENIVQGIARDIMLEGMWSAERAGYPIVLTVHDELLSERPAGEGSAEELARIVCDLPDWTDGCPITAEGFETWRYRKD